MSVINAQALETGVVVAELLGRPLSLSVVETVPSFDLTSVLPRSLGGPKGGF